MVLFKKQLTVLAEDVTGAPLTDFSLLVSIVDSDLQENARSDGFDIFFTESDEKTVIPYDRELYDSSTGELIAWVLVDLSDTTDNTFFMFYGDPDATDQQDPLPVWANFEDVFHFNQTSPLPWLNSSVGKDFSVDLGTVPPVSTTGQIDNGSTLSGQDTIFKMPNTMNITPDDYFVSIWVKRDSLTAGLINHLRSNTTTSNTSQLIFGNGTSINLNNLLVSFQGTPDSFVAGDMSDLQFHHVVARVSSGTNVDIFFDGDFISNGTWTVSTARFNGVVIGGTIFSEIKGVIDETRIAYNSNFSNGYIKTIFDNQKDASQGGQGAGNFVKVGVQQSNFSNNYQLLSQGAISEESSSIINAICGDSSLKIGDTVRVLPVGTGEGFTQPDDLLPRVGVVSEKGDFSYGIVVGGDFDGAYDADPTTDILSLGLVVSFFGDGIRICTQGKCLAFTDATTPSPINIGDGLTATASGLILASGTQKVIARALQSPLTPSFSNNIIAVDVQREG